MEAVANPVDSDRQVQLILDLSESADLLAAAAAAAPADAGAIGRLRADWPPDLVAAALTQAALRRRAVAKFGADSSWMFFTATGLEQSSRAEVAAHRARRLRDALHANALVADLCCGIGADMLAFARAGLRVIAVDRDPLTAAVAALNARRGGLEDMVQVRCADVTAVDFLAGLHAVDGMDGIDGVDAVFVDPARRSGGRRTFNPAAYSPPLDFVHQLAARFPRTAAKVAPGIPHDTAPAGAETEWVSWRGGLKEAVIWYDVPDGPGRRATVLPSGATLSSHDQGDDQPPVGPVGAYLYEPDDAVIRAGLVASIVAVVAGGRLLDPHIAYVTGDDAVDTPLASCFQVHESFAFNIKTLRARLRDHDAGILEIKVRGLDIDPDALRRQLKPSGKATRTVLLARVGANGALAVIATRRPADLQNWGPESKLGTDLPPNFSSTPQF
jgi:predicted RNA methylase